MPPSGFEWNEEKAQINLKTHGISFTEATTVFDDPNCLIMDDDEHSIGEARFLILGYSIANRLLLVVHCDRDKNIRLTFYDIAGEVFTDDSKTREYAPFVSEADDFIFLFDPTHSDFSALAAALVLALATRCCSSPCSGSSRLDPRADRHRVRGRAATTIYLRLVMAAAILMGLCLTIESALRANR
ncbi:MAG: BrnT family toxin, partial [Alkalinema sp. RU_4_3]|nr:BrnT family toxin [Alkalinema sp. RU_4_3]